MPCENNIIYEYVYHCASQTSRCGPKWLQHCDQPVIIFAAIGGEESWLIWWLTWLKLCVKVYAMSVGAGFSSFSPVAILFQAMKLATCK